MKREHIFEEKNLPEPLYYFPLTDDSNDVMDNFGSWTTNNLTDFGVQGARFDGSKKLYKGSFGKTFSDFTTYSFKYTLNRVISDVSTYMVVSSTSNTAINLFYAPVWNNDINFAVYYNGSYSTGSVVSVPYEIGREYTMTVRQNFSDNTTDLFIDGTLRGTATKIIPANTALNYFSIGYNYNASNRYFDGWIRDLMMFDVALTDDEIKNL